MAKSQKDERSTRRYNVRSFELYCSEGGIFSQLFKTRSSGRLPVVNFSVGGAQFLADKRFKEGEKLRINLSVPATAEPLPLDAQVRWCQQVPRRSAYRVGVKFSRSASRKGGKLQEIEARIASLTIRLLCPRCKSALSVKKKYEGSRARCPKCRTPVDVVEEEALPELESERGVASGGNSDGAGEKKGYGNLRKPFVHFLRSTIRSRLHLDVVQLFSRAERGKIAGSREVAEELGVSEREVREALRELVNRGILKEIGVKTFSYDPVPASRKHLAELASALKSADKRSRVLAVILEAEEK